MKCKYLILMTSLLMVYLCIGALVFRATEESNERMLKQRLTDLLDNFTATHNACVDLATVKVFVSEFIRTGNKFGHLEGDHTVPVWDFAGAFSFAVSVVTTIGYGHVFPGTSLGRSICVLYALIGIPFTMVVLRGIGEQLTKITKIKSWSSDPTVNRVVNSVVMLVFGLTMFFVLPSLMFSKIEGWSMLEGLYYCFVTLSTVGFGDYIAGYSTKFDNETYRNIYRVAVYLWVLVGLAYLSLVIKFISKTFVEKANKVKKEAHKRIGSKKLSINVKRRQRVSRPPPLETISDVVSSLEDTNDKSVLPKLMGPLALTSVVALTMSSSAPNREPSPSRSSDANHQNGVIVAQIGADQSQEGGQDNLAYRHLPD